MTPHGILDWLAVAFVALCLLTFAWVTVAVLVAEFRGWLRDRRRGGYLIDQGRERLP